MTRTLVASVGGSPQPVRSAIEGARWERVHFVVSEAPGGGSTSSRPMVDYVETFYRQPRGADPGERGPGLRHLPACPRDIAITGVPADDLDTALAKIDAALTAELSAGRSVTVDYTGGTKTMTAAMVLAATAHEGVRLQFMSGRRADLRQVEAGSEAPVEMPGALIGLARLFATARSFVRTHNYGAALAVMREAKSALRRDGVARPPKSWNSRIAMWTAWIAMMEAWDRFAHREAAELLAKARNGNSSWVPSFEAAGLHDRLEVLAASNGRPTPALLEDLWLNACRRAALGLHDDAVARLYRLAEACVQSRLWTLHGIDTARVEPGQLTDEERRLAGARQDRKGRDVHVLPLMQALTVLRRLDPGDPVVACWPVRDDGAFDHPPWQAARNNSILAHGFRALSAEDWKVAHGWFDERRAALWEAALGRVTAAQLPSKLP